jgi:hypothetical protein
VDDRRQLALYWTRDAGALPYYETAAPLRRLLQGWLRSKGLFVAHAAAIGRPDAGMLLAGRGGSGKSTTAVLSLGGDLMYASDDFSLVQCDPLPYVHSLYCTAKLNAETFEWMPEMRFAVSNAERLGSEKGLLFLDTCFRHKLALGFPLCAIVVPRVTGRPETVVTRASPLAAYRAVAPDTLFRTLGDARGVLRVLNRLVHELPCYDLALGTDRHGIGEVLRGVLARR